MAVAEKQSAETKSRTSAAGIKLGGLVGALFVLGGIAAVFYVVPLLWESFVTPALDHGPIIIQAAVPVLPEDDEASLAARVLEQEHVILPQAVRWFLEGRLHVDSGRVLLAGTAPMPNSTISPVPS